MVSTQVRLLPGPELACKLGATICNYVIWDAAFGNNLFKDILGEFEQVNIVLAWQVD